MEQTNILYDQITQRCKDIFLQKNQDYGNSWQILRLQSVTDLVYIKACRIRQLEELQGEKKVDEGVETEYISIINYCVIGLIKSKNLLAEGLSQAYFHSKRVEDSNLVKLEYDKITSQTKDLMERKNHDYGEAWRSMRISSITDQILMRCLRVKNIEDRGAVYSEGIEAEYKDIINWCIFALIMLSRQPQLGESMVHIKKQDLYNYLSSILDEENNQEQILWGQLTYKEAKSLLSNIFRDEILLYRVIQGIKNIWGKEGIDRIMGFIWKYAS